MLVVSTNVAADFIFAASAILSADFFKRPPTQECPMAAVHNSEVNACVHQV